MEKSEEMDHASKYFWSPMNLSSGSSSSGEINDEEEHVEHEELDEEYFCDYGNLPSLNGAYMRALLKTVNDKWDQEPIPAEERVSKVQFMPDECLVTVSYFITDEENRDYESSAESSMPCSTAEIVTLKPPEEVIELLEIVENENGIVEEDLFPDDFLDENPDDEDDIEIIQLVEKISLVSSAPGSEEFDPGTGNTNVNSQVSQDLIDLQTDDEQSQVTGPFSVTFSNSDAGGVSQPQPNPVAVLKNVEPAVIFNDPSIQKPDYSKFSSMFETALHPGVSVTNLGSLDSSSSDSISSAGGIANVNSVTGTKTTKKPLSQIEMDVSAEVARLNESLNKSNNNPEPEPVVPPPSSNPAVELIKKLSSQRLKTSSSLEITGMKLKPRTEPEVISAASEAKTTSVTSVRESKSGPTVVIRPRAEKATSVSDHSQASSKVSAASSHRSSSEEDQFLEGIKAVFNKKSLLALNKLNEPKRLPQAKAQILQRNISRTMLTNIFRPEFVQLLFDNEPPPQQSAASKWATRPVYNETLGYTVANGDVHNKDRFPNLKKPPFSVSVAPAPTPAMKVPAGTKKKKSEETKAKASVPNRSVSAKEKVSKLRSTINRLSPRPATTGSKKLNRISAEPSGLRLNASDQALNNTIARIRLEDEKKRQSFNSWLDKKNKESRPSRPSTVPAIQADPWMTRMKLDWKKAEDEILTKIKSDNNPRMMETYRAYAHAGYNLHPTTMPTYAQKKSLGTKSSFTRHH